jgi:N-acyl-D-aspartate/D-glutamate deacylase
VTQHSHYDVALFWDPYCSNSGENGVTTVVNANCGFGVAPVRPRDIERTMQMLETTEQIPVAHQRSALPWDWESFPEYLARVERLRKGVNVLTYLPLNPLLVYVMGIDAAKTRRPTAAEMAEMHRLINEAMDAGAIGISMSAMGIEADAHGRARSRRHPGHRASGHREGRRRHPVAFPHHHLWRSFDLGAYGGTRPRIGRALDAQQLPAHRPHA